MRSEDVRAARVKAWNEQPAHLRRSRLGLHRGASMFEAHQRLPFALPKKHRLRPDGSIGERPKRKPPKFIAEKGDPDAKVHR